MSNGRRTKSVGILAAYGELASVARTKRQGSNTDEEIKEL